MMSIKKPKREDDKQKKTIKERLREGDKTMFSISFMNISTNEIHAFILGLISGLIRFFEYGEMIILGLILFAIFGKLIFDYMDKDVEITTIGAKTIKHEPWYFISAILISYGITELIIHFV